MTREPGVTKEGPLSVPNVSGMLFVALFVLGLVLAANGSTELGKWAVMAGFGCFFVMVGLYAYRERDLTVDHLILAGILAAFLGLCAAGTLFAKEVLGISMPWAVAGAVPTLLLVGFLAIVRGILIAKYNSKLDESERYRYE